MRLEFALAVLCLALSILTAISGEWIEELTGLDPDAGSGALEWALVAALALAAVAAALFSRRDLHRLRAAR
jgi:hypothetical protein